MTFLGKLFVMVNVGISFLMAFVAFGLFATGLDYDSESKAKPGQPPARITALANEITGVVSTIPAVENGWREARNDLLRREEQRREDHVWYDKEMAFARTKATAADPVKTVRLDKHLPVLDKANKPTMDPAVDRAGQPLQSLAIYTKQLEDARKDNAAVLTRLQEEIAKDIEWTNQLTGTKDEKKPAAVPANVWRIGYRQLLVDEHLKREGIEDEISSVRPLFVNITVESELIRKRYESMQQRIAELKTYLKKKHKVDVALRGR
jgi:hypothetical protein